TDPFDQTGSQIFFDSFDGRRIDLIPMLDLELQSVAWVGFPEPGDFDFFALRDRKDDAHNRHTRGAVDLYARNRIVGVGVLVGDSTDGSLQCCWCALFPTVFHGAILLQRLSNRKPTTKIVGRSARWAYAAFLRYGFSVRSQLRWLERRMGLAFCRRRAKIRLMPSQSSTTRPAHFETFC